MESSQFISTASSCILRNSSASFRRRNAQGFQKPSEGEGILIMALAKANLESGWISRAISDSERSFSSITSEAYNPYLTRTSSWEKSGQNSATSNESAVAGQDDWENERH